MPSRGETPCHSLDHQAKSVSHCSLTPPVWSTAHFYFEGLVLSKGLNTFSPLSELWVVMCSRTRPSRYQSMTFCENTSSQSLKYWWLSM